MTLTPHARLTPREASTLRQVGGLVGRLPRSDWRPQTIMDLIGWGYLERTADRRVHLTRLGRDVLTRRSA